MSNSRLTQAFVIAGRTYIKESDGNLRPAVDMTDWKRLEAMTEEDIEAAAMSDPDNLPLTDDELAKLVRVPAKHYVDLGVDADLVDWFRQEGQGYQARINAVLRRYVEARRKAG